MSEAASVTLTDISYNETAESEEAADGEDASGSEAATDFE
jgi:hypothetical protein